MEPSLQGEHLGGAQGHESIGSAASHRLRWLCRVRTRGMHQSSELRLEYFGTRGEQHGGQRSATSRVRLPAREKL